MDTVFDHKVVHWCTWFQSTLGQRRSCRGGRTRRLSFSLAEITEVVKKLHSSNLLGVV